MKVVVPTQGLHSAMWAVDLAVHESVRTNSSPVSKYTPCVVRTGVNALPGGAPATLRGVNSVRLGLV